MGSFVSKVRRDPLVTEEGGTGREYTWQLLYLGLGILAVVFFAAAGYWTGAFLLVLLTLTGLAAWHLLASPGTGSDTGDSPDRAFAAVPAEIII